MSALYKSILSVASDLTMIAAGIFSIEQTFFIMAEKLDTLDQQILEIISQNARIPFKDVANVCGVSRAAIHQRVQHLAESGVITGSYYAVSPKSLGYSTCTYIGVKLEKASMYENVAKELGKIPEIVECHFTTGPYAMLVKLYTRDNEHLMQMLSKKIQQIEGIISTETLISLEESINRQIPIIVAEDVKKKTKRSRKTTELLQQFDQDLQDE